MSDKKPRLLIYESHSELFDLHGATHQFAEGVQSSAAKSRSKRIQDSLKSGYLQAQLSSVLADPKLNFCGDDSASIAIWHSLESLVKSVTGQYGRALVGLSIIQAAIKAIEAEQSIRLHKSGHRDSFGWQEGISMRSIDKTYITPFLRKNKLLNVNADGVMMTRTLAENYPYSSQYKADIRGAKKEWLEVVEFLEANPTRAEGVLKTLLALLIRANDSFENTGSRLLNFSEKYISGDHALEDLMKVFHAVLTRATHPARLFEIILHSLAQVVVNEDIRDERKLVPLSQMRSANKKHGNIADVEFSIDGSIVEAWEAKFEKTYLLEEVGEIEDKFSTWPLAKRVGFVVYGSPKVDSELRKRIDLISGRTGVVLEIFSFDQWVSAMIEGSSVGAEDVPNGWINAVAQSLAGHRRAIAPIDEPTDAWMETLCDVLAESLRR